MSWTQSILIVTGTRQTEILVCPCISCMEYLCCSTSANGVFVLFYFNLLTICFFILQPMEYLYCFTSASEVFVLFYYNLRSRCIVLRQPMEYLYCFTSANGVFVLMLGPVFLPISLSYACLFTFCLDL